MPDKRLSYGAANITLGDDYLRCRNFGHAWDDVSGLSRDGTPIPREYVGGTRLYLMCTRCQTYRIDVISRLTGFLLTRSYRYPEDYKIPVDKQVLAPTRIEFRLQYVTRFADIFAEVG